MLPFHVPDIGDEEVAEVLDVLRSGWLTTGPKTRDFEREFAAMVGAKHAVAVNSCTAALHLALEAAGIRRNGRHKHGKCQQGGYHGFHGLASGPLRFIFAFGYSSLPAAGKWRFGLWIGRKRRLR